MALRHPANITQLRWWGCTEPGVEALSFQIPGCHVQSQLFLPSLIGTGNEVMRPKKHGKSCIMGVPSTGCYTKTDPRMVCSWGHWELSWHCCNMDARFHNPHSAILLNLSHITLLTPLKRQTFAKVLKHNSTISSFCIPLLVMPSKFHDGSSNKPERHSYSGDSNKKRAHSSLEVMPYEVKAVGKGSGSQVRGSDKMSDSWQYKMAANPGKMPNRSNSELKSTWGHNYD